MNVNDATLTLHEKTNPPTRTELDLWMQAGDAVQDDSLAVLEIHSDATATCVVFHPIEPGRYQGKWIFGLTADDVVKRLHEIAWKLVSPTGTASTPLLIMPQNTIPWKWGEELWKDMTLNISRQGSPGSGGTEGGEPDPRAFQAKMRILSHVLNKTRFRVTEKELVEVSLESLARIDARPSNKPR